MPKISKEKADFKIVDAFNGLEIVDADYQEQSFSKHVHEGYTIGVINKGAQRFYRSGNTHIADENSMILVNADDVHNGESATEGGWRYRAMYPHPEHFERITQDLYGGKSHAPYFTNAVINDLQLSNQLRLLFEQIDNNASKLLVETILYSIMMNMTLRHSSMKNTPR
ncbi:AraC family ligand binding domain-containing protein [Moritella sp. 24]|uniref:AraC family ligand binding domain-containing protein n=1 Tax=Moritella sp. 24 TaxID=2746230 RepID=UPI00210599BB|nr:AraC family ligand binding domain-containing protein [Moritella sp. 24]